MKIHIIRNLGSGAADTEILAPDTPNVDILIEDDNGKTIGLKEFIELLEETQKQVQFFHNHIVDGLDLDK